MDKKMRKKVMETCSKCMMVQCNLHCPTLPLYTQLSDKDKKTVNNKSFSDKR
jgi:hypothetical protein